MPQISRTALVPYSAEQMYQLVNDVKSYPQFLPGCTGSRVLESTPGQMTAAVDVSKAGISKTFTTRNQLTSNQSILMHLVGTDLDLHRLALWPHHDSVDGLVTVGFGVGDIVVKLAGNMVEMGVNDT